MAFLGLRTRDAGLGGGSVADVLVKALTGDPEREMALARGRSDLELDAYRQKQMEAATAYSQAQADWQAGQNAAAVAAGPVIGRGIYDNINQDIEPVAVEAQPDPSIPMPTARPAYAPQLDAEPAPVEPLLMPTPAIAPTPPDRPGSLAIGRGVVPGEAVEPVPVDEEVTGLDTTNGATASGDWLPPGTPEPAAQVLPGEVREEPDGSVTVGTTEGPQRFTREEADKLGLLAAYSTDPAGQGGKQAGFMGTVYGDPNDPEQQRRNALLYAGKTAGESGGDLGKIAETLRKEYVANPSVKNFEDAYATLQGVEQAAKDNTGASDVAFMYGVMKAFDPGVSVQEGDKANAQATMNIPARVALMYNNAVDGKTDMFTPEVRAEFIQAVRGQVQGRRAQAERWMENYKEKARQQSVPPEWVVFDIPEMGEAPDLSRQLPPNVTEDMVAASMKLNPTWSREEVIKAILLDLSQQPAATGQ